MVKAYEIGGEHQPTATWIGEVNDVHDDHFTATIYDDYEAQNEVRVVGVPLSHITDSELPSVRPCMMFYCGIEAKGNEGAEDEIFNIVSIEFSQELTNELFQKTGRMILGTMIRAAEREF